jgi:general secretion pathway protein M
MKQLEDLQQWFQGLQARERNLVLAATVVMVATLFYIAIWEPLHNSLADETSRHQSQLEILNWMQNASAEVKALKASGSTARQVNTSQPVSLVIEKSATSSGLKPFITKLESTSDKGARIKIDAASFDQLVLWLNNLQTQYGISVISANLDRHSKPGTINARLTLNRN